MAQKYVYKISTKATYLGQSIVSTFYYNDFAEVITDDALAVNSRELIANEFLNHILDAVLILPLQYDLNMIDIRVAGEAGFFLDSGPIEISPVIQGGNPNTADGGGPTLIIKALLNPIFSSGFVPKSGYWAWGPISDTLIGPDGAHNLPLIDEQLLETKFSVPLQIFPSPVSPTELFIIPVKVSKRGINPGQAFTGVNRVVGATVRPFTSFRRSRVTKPTGVL